MGEARIRVMGARTMRWERGVEEEGRVKGVCKGSVMVCGGEN